jgi:hypothetical protein
MVFGSAGIEVSTPSYLILVQVTEVPVSCLCKVRDHTHVVASFHVPLFFPASPQPHSRRVKDIGRGNRAEVWCWVLERVVAVRIELLRMALDTNTQVVARCQSLSNAVHVLFSYTKLRNELLIQLDTAIKCNG